MWQRLEPDWTRAGPHCHLLRLSKACSSFAQAGQTTRCPSLQIRCFWCMMRWSRTASTALGSLDVGISYSAWGCRHALLTLCRQTQSCNAPVACSAATAAIMCGRQFCQLHWCSDISDLSFQHLMSCFRLALCLWFQIHRREPDGF